ncbi:hypothetical protein [Brevibacterium aurantiacum]|uniref:hypothetical protein n=1 Tax=Brevibacterium aurantiacum TaxID=273384 RepID=UPI0016430A64|nr:hypothetical protein [Brevibacterium aurantiacum]
MTEVVIVATAVTVMAAVALGTITAVGWAQYELERDQHRNSQKGHDYGRTTH